MLKSFQTIFTSDSVKVAVPETFGYSRLELAILQKELLSISMYFVYIFPVVHYY